MKFIFVIAYLLTSFFPLKNRSLDGNGFTNPKNGFQYENDQFEDILIKARMRKDLIFVFATTEGCHPCAEMENELSKNKQLVKLVNRNFVPYLMKKGDPKSSKFKGRYKLYQYPAILFLDSYGSVIAKLDGKRNPSEVLKFAKKITKKYSQE